MRNIRGFLEEEIRVIRLNMTGECPHSSPMERCRTLRQPRHMTSVNARDSPPCQHFAKVIVPQSHVLCALIEKR